MTDAQEPHPDTDDPDEDETAGWDAIDAALDRRYPGVEPRHLGTIIKWRLGGPDPLDGISVYDNPGDWHLISYGLSELYGKESDDPTCSGWGFEFTARVVRRDGDPDPVWAMNVMQNLARYVFSTGNHFGAGHHIDLNGPINLDRPDTAIRALAFITDPDLGEIDTPHGRLEFLQLVGLTMDEYEACKSWDTAEVMRLLAARDPRLAIDLDRESVLTDPQAAATVAAGIARDGSKLGALAVDLVRWEPLDGQTRVAVGGYAAPRIAAALAGRLPFGRDLIVDGGEVQLRFTPDEAGFVSTVDPQVVEIGLSPAIAIGLAAALRAGPGHHQVAGLPALVVEITA